VNLPSKVLASPTGCYDLCNVASGRRLLKSLLESLLEAWCPHTPSWTSRSTLPSSGWMQCGRMPEALQRYNSSLWMRYPLARRARRQVSVSSSSIVPNWRYLEIGFHQSTSWSGNPTITAISPSCPRFGSIGLAETHRLTMLLVTQKHVGNHVSCTFLPNTLGPGPSGLRLHLSRSLCPP
jgi:hypothetical protein